MIYGYTVADAADHDVFQEAAEFIELTLHYSPIGSRIEDVDGSLFQHFSSSGATILLESNEEVGYVGIRSSAPLPITCLRKWTEDGDITTNAAS